MKYVTYSKMICGLYIFDSIVETSVVNFIPNNFIQQMTCYGNFSLYSITKQRMHTFVTKYLFDNIFLYAYVHLCFRHRSTTIALKQLSMIIALIYKYSLKHPYLHLSTAMENYQNIIQLSI